MRRAWKTRQNKTKIARPHEHDPSLLQRRRPSPKIGCFRSGCRTQSPAGGHPHRRRQRRHPPVGVRHRIHALHWAVGPAPLFISPPRPPPRFPQAGARIRPLPFFPPFLSSPPRIIKFPAPGLPPSQGNLPNPFVRRPIHLPVQGEEGIISHSVSQPVNRRRAGIQQQRAAG